MLYLDKNPAMCAKSTPVGYMKHILTSIRDAFLKVLDEPAKGSMYDVQPLSVLVYYDISYSKKNYDWYIFYYKELAEIYREVFNEEVEELVCGNIQKLNKGEFMGRGLLIHTPMQDAEYQSLVEKYKDKYDKIEDLNILSRVMLYDLRPQFEDFARGVPHWLTEADPEVITAYDAFNKRHIRIERSMDGRRYRYFVAIISNNWREITDVPPEIDIIVNYLISNRANLALIDESKVDNVFFGNSRIESKE